MKKYVSVNTTVDVEVDLDDFDNTELMDELKSRGSSHIEHEHLLRHGIEDRDWSKIEEFAEKLDVHFFRKS